MSTLHGCDRFTIKQVAEILSVHVSTVWRWISLGVRGRKLKTLLIGGRRFVLQSELDRFLSPTDSERNDNFVERAGIYGKLLDAKGLK